MPDIQLDPTVIRARAAQLAESSERLFAAAAAVRESAPGVGLLGAVQADRHQELVDGLRRSAGTLADLADRMRRDADAAISAEQSALARITAITRSLG